MLSSALSLLWMHRAVVWGLIFPLAVSAAGGTQGRWPEREGGWGQPQGTNLDHVLPFEDGARNRLQRGTWLGEPKGLGENTGLFFSLKPLEIAKQGEIMQNILQKTLVPNRHVVSPAKALVPGERDLISLSSLLLA